MYTNIIRLFLMFVEIILCYSQRTGYNETCNSTEECSDHRYKCQSDDQNVLRCLCDRFHAWDDDVGCVQIYNASEILNMTVVKSVTDNIRFLEERVDAIIRMQIAAGFFVFGMVIVATVIVTVFCVYVHLKDRAAKKSAAVKKRANTNHQQTPKFPHAKPSTSVTIV